MADQARFFMMNLSMLAFWVITLNFKICLEPSWAVPRFLLPPPWGGFFTDE